MTNHINKYWLGMGAYGLHHFTDFFAGAAFFSNASFWKIHTTFVSIFKFVPI
ncbi:DUF6220 domain-containing protein [Saccharococcus caldoxylosilyticus]|uniref:DUF6220 domain-containing protein n=1 Tax=Saccharococcus caldoxylosilyticus TaxID=81408 RepID=UPI00204CA54F|nr:hypothetical protein PcaKH16_37600 [Parageobacillus caldoxylosilyticus]